MRSLPARLLAITAMAVPAGLAACGDDAGERSEANYCTQVGNYLDELNAPVIVDGADVDRVVGAWRAVARTAPIAIEAEWNAMVDNLVTAATVDSSDPASVQLVADTARRSEPAANLVIVYTQQKCGARIGGTAIATTTPTTSSTLVPVGTDTAP